MKTNMLLLILLLAIGLDTPQFLWGQIIQVGCMLVILASVLYRMFKKWKHERKKKEAELQRASFRQRRKQRQKRMG